MSALKCWVENILISDMQFINISIIKYELCAESKLLYDVGYNTSRMPVNVDYICFPHLIQESGLGIFTAEVDYFKECPRTLCPTAKGGDG